MGNSGLLAVSWWMSRDRLQMDGVVGLGACIARTAYLPVPMPPPSCPRTMEGCAAMTVILYPGLLLVHHTIWQRKDLDGGSV